MKKDRTVTTTIELSDNSLARALFGEGGENLKRLEQGSGVLIDTRGSAVTIKGAPDGVRLVERLVIDIYALLEEGSTFSAEDIEKALAIVSSGSGPVLKEVFSDAVYVTATNKKITPKSIAQKSYVDCIRGFDMVFSIGPAGTGKTYLAMASAVAALAKKEVDRIILTRPAVEAGEKLGFLPGDIVAKVDPYLRPLYDALHDMMDFDRVQRLLDRGSIEVAPLAFMRGRTLNNSFIILDEAQNTTIEQMKMFLTRLGFGSKVVITGDITQIDLPLATPSGLVEVEKILKGVHGIVFVHLTEADVVRHSLVQELIKAFERHDRKEKPIVEEV